MKVEVEVGVDDVTAIVVGELIWFEQTADLTNKQREAYQLVIRDFLTPDELQLYLGEEIDE